ncbi:hypothetical protein [Hydrogenophaga sp.]|uniref:hypothetical protein n=1 Tax=Hydrogenophaga sp. TaxID=1904254 RepID=UPI00260AF1AC|nr:hypothetical protein [Hydrogenophaga sp.]MDM7949379.1 hypothetical protein [Hydrogenophaga sp.]
MTPDTSSSASFRALSWFALFVGLGVVAWVASGFVGTSAFALGMTLLIGAVYLGGVWELRRFGQTTTALNSALANVPLPLNQLADWLPRVPASLQHAVRQRIEGERSAFPGLALTPYLIGLLVMLGMLGTFLGMVVTFKGAVFALEGSADLNAIRSALAAPIKGLGLSFGTSVAGVATSAMLGLMATLARRERSQVIRALDGLTSTTLRPFSAAHQRQQSFEALQRQAEAMPAAALHLQTLIEQMERRSQQLDEQLLARQAEFQSQAASAYTGLAESVDRSLRESLAASARAATDSLQPVVQQAMAGIAAESSRLHEGVSAAVQAQLAGLSDQFGQTTQAVAGGWSRALAERAQADQQQQAAWTASLQSLAQSLQGQWQQAGAQAQAQQQAVLQALEQSATAIAEQSREQASRSLDSVARLIGQTEALVAARAQAESAWTQEHGQRMDALASLWRSELAALRSEEAARQQDAAQRAAELQTGVAQQLAALQDGAAKQLATLREAEATRQQAQTEQQERTFAALTQQLQSLREEEGARGEAAVQRLGGLTTALSSQLASQLSTLGTALEAPMARLMHTASEAPKAAAEVIAQLREQMSRLAERDNATLAERADLVGQIGMLLQQVQQTTGEQRAAIENLVGSATGVLDRVGQQFADTVGAQAGRAEAMAEQAASSAAQLAALGEAFQQGTQQLATSHEQLVHSLQRVEGAIGQSLARSDEQLAYYVAQAREVIDLSISAQQGIVEDLRQLRGPRPPGHAGAKATAGAA